MLTELRIANFAVLEQLSLSLDSGFTVLTGETGAGKSLLIDAIALLVGGRASVDQIRFGEEEAELEAAFHIPETHPVLQRLRTRGILEPQESDLIIRRVIARSGRNRVYVNGKMCSLHLLEEFGGTLVDIHGQHDQQSLLSPSTQLDVVDIFADLLTLRDSYQEAYAAWKQSCQAREQLATSNQQALQREEFLKYQWQELHDAAPLQGEEDMLQAERRRLGSSRRIDDLTVEAQECLHADQSGLIPGIGGLERALGELSHIDPDIGEVVRLANEAKILLKEVAGRLRDYADRIDTDPGRLAVIEDRLAVLQKLKKKYGGSIEAVIATQDRLRQELEDIDNSDAELKRHDDLIHHHQRTMSRLAQQLTRKRSEAAGRMTKAVRLELNALKMNQTQFLINVTSDNGEGSWGSNGSDRAEFLFSANVGEPLQPLSRVASGGELSRVMLALKSVLATADQVPVLIFDEIDMGVGGAVAAAIGKRLRAIGRFHQVFCITHLPQVASQAQHHLCVEKVQSKNRTLTSVRTLSGLQRETEIARMLGGETVTKKVRDTAAELIAGASD